MEIFFKEGCGVGLVSPRRLKSFKCIATLVVMVNVIIFLSLAWKTSSSPPDLAGLVSEPLKESIPRGDKQLPLSGDSIPQMGFEGAHVRSESSNTGSHASINEELEVAASSQRESIQNKMNTPAASFITGRDGIQKSVCSYRTAVYMNNRHIKMDKSPFSEYVNEMICLEDGRVALFSSKFAKFSNVILDSSRVTNLRKGGEQMQEVWNQPDSDEYLNVLPRYFQMPCTKKIEMSFSEMDHLNKWKEAVVCYNVNVTDIRSLHIISGTALAIQRYEYVNLYHTVCDFYNAFILMLIFGVPSHQFHILAVDAHPEGKLDSVWDTLFGKFIRAGRLTELTVFPNLIWGLLGYFSPLNEHERENVPYLDEFREFFLSQFNVSTHHLLDCKRPKVVLIWRRDYIAHPRNPGGSVVRKFANEEEMVEQVKKTLGSQAHVEGLQLDALPMKTQLETIASCDILIGMHGAGLSHILFLSGTSGVIELKPQYSNPALQHFQAMSKWRNLPYSIWNNYEIVNEKDNHKTYIPLEVLANLVTGIYSKICPNSS